MKKFLSAILVLSLVFTLAACGGDSSLWKSNDTFENVVVCKYGDVISADFGTTMNVKIKGTDYKHFIKYIDDLKKAGFSFLQVGNGTENYTLYDGSAQWRCTDGNVYLQLIFAEDKSTTYDLFGCNLQIYGYDDSSYFITKKDSSEKKNSKKDKTKTTTDNKTSNKNK